MRVGIYTNRLPYPPIGGNPRFLHEFAQTLIRRGYEIDFLLPNVVDYSDSESPINSQTSIEAQLLHEMGVKAKPISKILANDVKLDLSVWNQRGPYGVHQIFSLHGMNTREALRIVDSHDILMIAGSPLLLFSQPNLAELIEETSVPTIFELLFPLGELEFYLGNIGRDLVARRIETLANMSHVVVVPSSYVMNELATYCSIARPVKIIPHGIRLPERPSNSTQREASRTLVTISRGGYFAQHKNIDSVLDAWPLVRRAVPGASLVLIGASSKSLGPYRSDGSNDGIFPAGEVTDSEKLRLLQKGRAFVLPSAIEAFGFAFAEALAAGLPPIGLDATAVREMVVHNWNGLLLEPKSMSWQLHDRVATLAKPDVFDLGDAMIRLLRDDSLLSRLGFNCRESAERYSWSNIFEEHRRLFSELT